MLNWLQIKHFAIADHIELDMGAGLSVITGETGAGKSIIIRALGQLLGQRADTKLIKHGHSRAEVQANFDISSNSALIQRLAELELDEEAECQLRRVINKQAGSKSYINGRMVTAGIMREIAEQLMDIHGQHEHQSLLKADIQRELLDKYAGTRKQLQSLKRCVTELKHDVTELETIRSDAATAHEKLAFLQYQVDELSEFSPGQHEWEQLYIKHQRAHHQAELATAVQTAQSVLFGDNNELKSADSQLGMAISELEKAKNIDPGLQSVLDILLEAQTLVNESETNLSALSETVTLDDAELELIEQRYAKYMEFARKHRVKPEKVYALHQSLLKQLDGVQNPEQNEKILLENIRLADKRYQKLAATISRQRKKHATKLEKNISDAMQTLAMEGGSFHITLSPSKAAFTLPDSDSTISETGNETVLFEVTTNAGMPKQPLAKVASGGELSRISLAIQLILADLGKIGTLVFDEVDVGVGGKTAAIIGEMLAALSASKQILCITHLPQVAAFGSAHYSVDKQQGKQVQLSINALSEDEKISEIARMVGGANITDETLAHARALIQQSTPHQTPSDAAHTR